MLQRSFHFPTAQMYYSLSRKCDVQRNVAQGYHVCEQADIPERSYENNWRPLNLVMKAPHRVTEAVASCDGSP